MSKNLGNIAQPPTAPIPEDRRLTLPRKLRELCRHRLMYNEGYEKEVAYYQLWACRALVDTSFGFGIKVKAGDTFLLTGLQAYDAHMYGGMIEFVDIEKYRKEEAAHLAEQAKLASPPSADIQPFQAPNPKRRPENAFVAATYAE